MAGIDFDRTDRGGWDERDSGGIMGYTNPEMPQAGPTADAGRLGAVQGYYKTYLGRDAEAGAAENWAGQGFDLPTIENYIKNSDEGKAYAARQTSTSTTGSDPRSLFAQVFQKYNLDPNNPGHGLADINYFLQRLQQTNPNDVNYWAGPNMRLEQEIRQALYGEKGNLLDTGGGSAGNPGGYTDPSSILYLNEAMNRLNQLKQPQAPDPALGQLTDAINALVARSKQPVYTPADEAALIARMREPLTQARDAALRQNRESASARGFLPSSGLLRGLERDTQNAYIKGVAGSTNDLAVRGIDEQNNRSLQAIQALSALVGANRTAQDRTDARADQVVSLAKLFPDFDNQRLSQLLAASSESPSAGISGLTSLANLGLSQQQLANLAASDQGNALAMMLYQIYKNLGLN